ncbi:MAG TPA: serine/threonine-protein kinase [Kofleriaceae bacterium]|nr:serine/threonine-protein kinase [Kofleriaceae bacterium]
MGVVYRGFDLDFDQTIAIKVLRPGAVDNVARFEREASILATLDHPGVVRYVTHGVAHEGSSFLVMEWVDGTTLAEHHARVGLTPADAVAVARRVAEALGAAHARGLVHRDVKPENILLEGGDLRRPKVIDFGLVRRASGDARLTETGVVVGTPGYMAPEQARGEREIDARSDVFALGCVLYECVSGVPAFGGRNVGGVMARIVLCDPPALRDVMPDVPAGLERIVARMLAKRRDDRPRDAAAVASELAAVEAPRAPARRRAGSEEAPTTVDTERLPVAAHVIFVQATEVTADVEPLVARFGARAHRLVNDTIVLVVDDVAVAADCAIALARGLDPAPVVLVGPSDAHAPAAPLGVLLDTGAGELELADLQRIFGGAALPPGVVRVDATTAARLAGRFDIREDQGTHYVIGRKSP